MAKKRKRSAYQREREALIKRAKRKGYKLDIPTQAQQLQYGKSKTELGKEAKQLHKLRGNKLETYVDEGGEYNEKYFWQVSSSEGQMRNKNTGKVMYDLISPDKGTEWYKINPNTGEVEYNNIDIFTGRVEGSVDPNKSDAELEKEYKEVEEKYPSTPTTYNDEPDPASSISDYLLDNDWDYDDEDDEIDEYGEGNNQPPDIHDYEDDDYTRTHDIDEYGEGNNKPPDYHDYSDYEDEDDIESDYGYDLAEQAYKDASDIIDTYNNNKFIVTNAGGHQGYYVNSEETKRKLHDILDESYNEATNDNDTAYQWGLEMERNLGNLQEAIEAGTDAYSDDDYQTSLANIAYILNGGIPLDIDTAMDLGSSIDLGEDYEEGW